MIDNKKFVAIPNLDRKIEESLFDAVRHFDKNCPYCGTNLYGGNIRNKIETDHYIPIDLGGQHVPWNVLPTCKICNRKKSNKHPNEFLDIDIQTKCESFLKDIKLQIANSIQDDIDSAQQAKILIKNKIDIVLSLEAKEVLLELSRIFSLDLEDNNNHQRLPHQLGFYSIQEYVKSVCKMGIGFSVSKNLLYSQYESFCSVNNMQPLGRVHFFRGVFSVSKEISSFRPRINGIREQWVAGITIREE